MSDTNIKSGINKSLEKIKERTHRSSLTVAFSLFVFLILITALGLGTLAMYILAETGVIGEELEIGTVKSRLNRARGALKELLSELYSESAK